MSKPKIIVSSAYKKRLGDIEDFVYESSGQNYSAVDAFLSEHDRVLEFIKNNPMTPASHPQTGDQTWPFGDGRYRLFFKFNGEKIDLLEVIDNRMSNLKIYPNNSLPTYHED